MKLHIGCGSVYLEGYTNIDVYTPSTFLAEKRPDLVDQWKTTDDDYYAHHKDKTQDKLRKGPLEQEYVCDAYGDLTNIPAPYWKVEEVLVRQTFEHLSIGEARKALDSIDSILAPNGCLRIDVPDHEATLTKYRETADEFYRRHLLGPRRDDYGYHMMSYTRERLRRLVEEHGFVFVEEEKNIHFYPAFCLRFVKPGPRATRDYAWPPPFEIPDNWEVLEVGPGLLPLPRANVYADLTMTTLQPLQDNGKSTVVENLMTGFPGIATKRFDYVWCSHVLEHVEDPVKCAATLSRVAKRGTVILPSMVKESLFNFEEDDHKWIVVPSPNGGGPIFIRRNEEYIRRLKNETIQKIASRLFRTGPNRIEEARQLRKWFYENEINTDIVVHWHDNFNVQVVG